MSSLRLVLGLSLFLTSLLNAQPNRDDYVFKMPDVSGFLLSTAEVPVLFDNLSSEGISGFSFGVCYDPSVVTIVSVDDGPGIAQVTNGGDFAFNQVNLAPNPPQNAMPAGLAGWTVGAIANFLNPMQIVPGEDYNFYVATYTLDNPGMTEVQFCDAQFSPPSPEIMVLVTLANSSTLPPSTESGSVTVTEEPDVSISIPTDLVGAQTQQVEVPVLLSNKIAIEGFSFSVQHDPAILTLIDIEPGQALLDLDADFATNPERIFRTQIEPSDMPGGTVAVVPKKVPPFESIAAQMGDSPPPQEIAKFIYQVSATAADEATTELTFATEFGEPSINPIVVVLNSVGAPSAQEDTPFLSGLLTVSGDPVDPVVEFVRGDLNEDGVFDSTEIPLSLDVDDLLAIECQDVADADDNGVVDNSDVMYLFMIRFQGAPCIEPCTACGEDPTDDSLVCDSFDACP